MIDLVWTPVGHFERRLSIAPGKVAELGGAPAKAVWTNKSAAAVALLAGLHKR